MSTRAIKFLEEKNIPFEVVRYRHAEKGAEFAARATGFALEKTVKTLVVDLGGKKCLLALLPGDKQLDLKGIARICSVKKAVMAATETAERLTGYQVGGISPFGVKQSLPVVIEESILQFDRVLINAGQRGMMLLLRPGDIMEALEGKVSKIAREQAKIHK
jgi:Cys-tRNA(Pro)/Cys-tRNA(Cys) deacylase